MANVNGVADIEGLHQLVDVCSVRIHFIASFGLRGTAMSAPVMSNHAKTALEKEHHLRVPIVCRERPAMMKEKRLSRSPILVINLRSVFCSDRSHDSFSFLKLRTSQIANSQAEPKLRVVLRG